MTTTPMIIIKGPCRSGKTTEVLRLAKAGHLLLITSTPQAQNSVDHLFRYGYVMHVNRVLNTIFPSKVRAILDEFDYAARQINSNSKEDIKEMFKASSKSSREEWIEAIYYYLLHHNVEVVAVSYTSGEGYPFYIN